MLLALKVALPNVNLQSLASNAPLPSGSTLYRSLSILDWAYVVWMRDECEQHDVLMYTRGQTARPSLGVIG